MTGYAWDPSRARGSPGLSPSEAVTSVVTKGGGGSLDLLELLDGENSSEKAERKYGGKRVEILDIPAVAALSSLYLTVV